MSGGVAALAGGITMMISAGTTSYQVNYENGERYENGDPMGEFGSILAGFGIPMTAGGIVLTVIGSKKNREYKGKLENALSKIELGIDLNSILLT
jgi:hypothetical protein